MCQYFTMYSGLKPDITLSTTELTMIDRDRIRWISTVFRHLIDLAWRTWIRTHTHISLGQINCTVYMQMEKFRKAPCEIQFPEFHWMKICKQGNWYCRPVRKSTRYPFPWAAPKDNGPFTRSGSVSIFSGNKRVLTLNYNALFANNTPLHIIYGPLGKRINQHVQQWSNWLKVEPSSQKVFKTFFLVPLYLDKGLEEEEDSLMNKLPVPCILIFGHLNKIQFGIDMTKRESITYW